MLEKFAEWYLTHIRVRKILKDAKSASKAKKNEIMRAQFLRPAMERVSADQLAMKFIKLTSQQKDHDNPNLVLVPEFDYNLLKIIRSNLGRGITTDIYPPEKLMELEGNIDTDLANKMQFKNAEQLHKFYGYSKQEVLEITGCHLK